MASIDTGDAIAHCLSFDKSTKSIAVGCSDAEIKVINIEKGVKPREEVTCEIKYKDGSSKKIQLLCRIDTKNEIEYYKNGGILQYVLRNMLN